MLDCDLTAWRAAVTAEPSVQQLLAELNQPPSDLGRLQAAEVRLRLLPDVLDYYAQALFDAACGRGCDPKPCLTRALVTLRHQAFGTQVTNGTACRATPDYGIHVSGQG